MRQGKLYKCPKYYLLFYPTKEKAESRSDGVARTQEQFHQKWWWMVTERSGYWSDSKSREAHLSEPDEVFMCLTEPKDAYALVLFGDRQGWISIRDWLEIEEIGIA